MRTTIDLPTDLHRVVTSVAAHTHKSMNQTVVDLIRRGLAVAPAGSQSEANAGSELQTSARTGLPVIRSARPVTAEDVRALEDE